MEDDCVLGPEINRPQVSAQLQSDDWDIAYLGWIAGGTPISAQPGDQPFIATTVAVMGAHAVAYTHECLTRMVKELERRYALPHDTHEGFPILFDGELTTARWKLGNIRELLAVPSLAHQRSSSSDISPGKYDRSWLGRTSAGRWTLNTVRRLRAAE